MLREVTMEDISDGRTYELNDMVKCDTGDCKDCHKCCMGMGTSIILDPIDIVRLKYTLGFSFEELLKMNYIELNMVDGLILPNIKMNESDMCSFLNESGRCSIHKDRPGICRIFPLGRVYDDKAFKYFVQKGECIKEANLIKIKVKKWIDTEQASQNQKYIMKWHSFIRNIGDKMLKLRNSGRGEILNDIAMYVLNEFYVKDFTLTDRVGEEKENYIDDFYNLIFHRIDEAYESIAALD